jgi:hypothetical protein
MAGRQKTQKKQDQKEEEEHGMFYATASAANVYTHRRD